MERTGYVWGIPRRTTWPFGVILKITSTELDGVKIIEPAVFKDQRGFFMETWRKSTYEDIGAKNPFVQDNVSFSSKGILRGLHFQNPSAQGKLVTAYMGEIFDVVVDIRKGSGTFGKWIGVTLSSDNNKQIYVPEGFAHGFLVTSDTALITYKCTDYYNSEAEKSISWDDPDIGVKWPIDSPTLSAKDSGAKKLSELDDSSLPAL